MRENWGIELDLTDAVSSPQTALNSDCTVIYVCVCVCTFLFKQYIRVAQLLRFWKSTLFDAELDTLMPCVKIPVTLKYEHSTEG